MRYKRTAELHNQGIVILDGGFIIKRKDQSCPVTNPTPYAHFESLDGIELKSKITEQEYNHGDPTDSWSIYDDKDTLVLKYLSKKGDLCVGAFLKLPDIFYKSVFNKDEDKEFVKNIVAKIDENGSEIKLGDYVNLDGTCSSGRIVWLQSNFYIYDEEDTFIELRSSEKVVKLN